MINELKRITKRAYVTDELTSSKQRKLINDYYTPGKRCDRMIKCFYKEKLAEEKQILTVATMDNDHGWKLLRLCIGEYELDEGEFLDTERDELESGTSLQMKVTGTLLNQSILLLKSSSEKNQGG